MTGINTKGTNHNKNLIDNTIMTNETKSYEINMKKHQVYI